MRVIITGGSGLIGTALSAELAGAGHEVIILSRNPDKASRGLRSGIRAERWDGRTADGWGPLADGAGVIVNLAGESIAGDNPVSGRWTAERKRAIRDSRVNAGQAVVAAVRAAKQKPAVVQASAVGYYGPHGDEVVTEDTPAGSDFLSKVCVDWEASTAEVTALGARRAVARTGILLSPDGGALPPLRLVTNLGGAGPMGSGRQYWAWIHMADEIAALRYLVESSASGPYNLCAPNPVTNGEFMKTLARVMHRPSFLPTPAFALRLMAGELADSLFLTGQRPAPKRLEEEKFGFKFPVLEPALRDLMK